MKKIAIYTSIMGGYEGLLPQRKIKGADFICFSDTPLKARPWKTLVVTPPPLDPTRQNRYYKLLPHLYLPGYEASIYIDGNVVVEGNVVEWAWELLEKKAMWAFDHKQSSLTGRDCLYEEHQVLLTFMHNGSLKDDPSVMNRQIARYRAEGYPAHNGLNVNTVLIRKHHDSHVIKTMELWWEEVRTGSKRDQLSFNYAAWKTGLDFGIVPGKVSRHPHFHMIGIHRKDYRMKYIRYRLKRMLGLL
ncbi:glycosyltransferase domain-containing protein [Cesiribacter andamanensis]|uniref:TOD1/MUCI70 glycosyltransferase-like domain-containing protein n=1 Tax=Cesiribacter andamanensis AMV16 TaxID=1279009 RepID=M7N102_9BACT|nr:glycosyltransferase domain-containing protein [Cesiribacter andamanensis]EMR02348.1 hypothetical protein ADICEAN_02497 [Cesiribacter andamanensis AMV16]